MSEDNVAHLLELRKRVLLCLAVTLVIACFTCWTSNWYLDFLLRPLKRYPARVLALRFEDVLWLPFQVGLYTASLVASPFWMWQVWCFLAPGFQTQERQLWKWIFLLSFALFWTGLGFAYYVLLPAFLALVFYWIPSAVQFVPSIGEYWAWAGPLLWSTGLLFQLPLILFMLLQWKWVRADQLRSARPMVVVGIFTVSMFLTPPDVWSQCLLAVPLVLLFEISLWASERKALSRLFTDTTSSRTSA